MVRLAQIYRYISYLSFSMWITSSSAKRTLGWCLSLIRITRFHSLKHHSEKYSMCCISSSILKSSTDAGKWSISGWFQGLLKNGWTLSFKITKAILQSLQFQDGVITRISWKYQLNTRISSISCKVVQVRLFRKCLRSRHSWDMRIL